LMKVDKLEDVDWQHYFEDALRCSHAVSDIEPIRELPQDLSDRERERQIEDRGE